MNNRPAPLYASDATAAKLLDMGRGDFLRLVDGGHLPKPRDIGGMKRWDVPELQKIINGDAVDGMADVDWSA